MWRNITPFDLQKAVCQTRALNDLRGLGGDDTRELVLSCAVKFVSKRLAASDDLVLSCC